MQKILIFNNPSTQNLSQYYSSCYLYQCHRSINIRRTLCHHFYVLESLSFKVFHLSLVIIILYVQNQANERVNDRRDASLSVLQNRSRQQSRRTAEHGAHESASV